MDAGNDVTTGPEIIRGALAALAFGLILFGVVWLNFQPWSEFANRPFIRWFHWSLLALFGVGGLIALIVGLICWVTGTQLGAG